MLQQLLVQEQFPSLAAAVVKGNEVESCALGMIDVDRAEPATAVSLYHLGSVTKIFTAVYLMQLRDEGIVVLDDAVNDYLPELNKTSLPRMTLRQLVSHRAGLPTMPPLPTLTEMMETIPPALEDLATASFPTSQQIIASLRAVEPIGKPGTRVSYSNLGIALLAEALRRASGEAYRDAIQRRILKPLGMRSGVLLGDGTSQPTLATCYLPFFEPPIPAPEAMQRSGGFEPAGGLWASAADMVQFMLFLTGNSSATLLARKSLLEMTKLIAEQPSPRDTELGDQTAVSGTGIGWFLTAIDGERVAEHGGADPATAVHLAWMPQKNIATFTATNSGHNPAAVAALSHALLKMAAF